ncbi:MAG: glycosyl hydrolase family 28 protein, partial [Bacteroidales bacterium]|nr:glycosyl hydrolase family 28 protein [Bacteroidales bacterium]
CATKPKVSLYTAPDGLEGVQGLEESKLFDLSVNGQDAFVYRGFEIKDKYEWYGDAGEMVDSPSYHGLSYCNFSMTKPVDLVIQLPKETESWKLRPEIEAVTEGSNHTLSLTLEKPRKFVVSVTVPDDEEERFFLVSAEKPETNIPNPDAKNVLYLGPGIHRFGQAWDPYVDGVDTVYLAPGAIVEASIKCRNKEGIKLLGRGIFAQSFITHAEEVEKREEQEWDSDWMGACFINCKDVEAEGVTFLNSPGYQFELADCDNATVKNVKLCGFGEHNNDGFHTYGRNIHLEDCFVAGNDDRICITGLYDKSDGDGNIAYDGTLELTDTVVENITIRNMVFLGLHNNGGDIMLTWNGSDYARDITIEDCYSLAPTNLAFMSARHGGSAIIHDVKIKNIHLDHPRLFWIFVEDSGYFGKGGGACRDFTFEDITINAEPSEVGVNLVGESDTSDISDFTLKNVKANGQVITDIKETAIQTNEFVKDIKFEK